MLTTFARHASSLLFPSECEACGALLNSVESPGACQICVRAIRLIPPPHCAGCGRSTSREGERCPFCLKESFHFDRAFACAVYEGKMKSFLHAFKFDKRWALKHFLAGIMVDFLQSHMAHHSFEVVVPVPLDRDKWIGRGENPSKLLSAVIAKKMDLLHLPSALGQRERTPSQHFLSREERRRNAKGRFYAQSVDLAGAHVLLIDDILTTGQTASECARVLKEAGAAKVTLLAAARGQWP
ncbi:MAG: ComF family protein [Candidatus Omnitrophica bacterium]|nr:ComF family protein [Candidatus Omnitrophota bacterium]